MKDSPRLTRRGMLIAGAGIATLGSVGVLWVRLRSSGRLEWIQSLVRRNLPNIRLDDASLAAFAQRMADEPEFRSKKVELALGLDSAASALIRLAPEVQRKIERLERVVMSEYLLSGNFFRVADPRAETIVAGEAPQACGNPFAVFRGS